MYKCYFFEIKFLLLNAWAFFMPSDWKLQLIQNFINQKQSREKPNVVHFKISIKIIPLFGMCINRGSITYHAGQILVRK